jgi:hypothetical protein
MFFLNNTIPSIQTRQEITYIKAHELIENEQDNAYLLLYTMKREDFHLSPEILMHHEVASTFGFG